MNLVGKKSSVACRGFLLVGVFVFLFCWFYPGLALAETHRAAEAGVSVSSIDGTSSDSATGSAILPEDAFVHEDFRSKLAENEAVGVDDEFAAVGKKELLFFFDEADLIVSATKHPLSLKKAPAIATIFTAKDLRNMGARDISDVLRRVPGYGVSMPRFGLELIEVRGVTGARSEKIKFLIDGHSVNNNMDGGIVWGYENLSLNNVKRIEVIRGPGSALYGSNAFLGVISVVTKDGKDIDGVTLSAGAGSFDTEKYNLLAGKRFGDLDVALMLDYLTSDGDKLLIKADTFGVSGKTDDFEDKFDAQLKLAYKDLSLNARYIDRTKGPYLGVGSALNDESKLDMEQFFVDLIYKTDLLDGDLPVTARAYMDHLDWRARWELFSEGTAIPPPPFPPAIIFPAGAIGIPSHTERTVGVELQADYNLRKDNLFTVGALFENRKLSDVQNLANFDPSFGDPDCAGLPPSPFLTIMDVSATCNWNKNVDRDIWALYVQDVWDITDTVTLTAGVRHDDYSDFGNSTNPRVAVVWGFKDDWDLKLMYATAFRAPSFTELYNDHNPAEIGNPGLDAEKVKTYEVSIAHTYKEDTTLRTTYFNNTITDKIESVPTPGPGPDVFSNTGEVRVWGVEVEAKRKLRNGSTLYANYTYQDTEDRDTGRELADVAKHKGNVGADISVTDWINANVNVLMVGGRPRAAGDVRADLAGHTVVDLTFIAHDFTDKGLEFRLSGHNIFDEQYEDPSTPDVPGDFPRDGASVMAEASCKF